MILCQDHARRLGSSNGVMEVVCQWGGYVIQCQDRARRLSSSNVVIEVVC